MVSVEQKRNDAQVSKKGCRFQFRRQGCEASKERSLRTVRVELKVSCHERKGRHRQADRQL
jgi:hypothetical protein